MIDGAVSKPFSAVTINPDDLTNKTDFATVKPDSS
jgi:hypothetical protein